MTEFWPISLCNVAYKLISKTLAKRLKAILPMVITENQSVSKAFDKVEWGFVRGLMERIGFDGKWISLIMQCILDKATPSLQASSSYMLKAYQHSSINLPVLKLFMVYPYVGANQTSPTYSS